MNEPRRYWQRLRDPARGVVVDIQDPIRAMLRNAVDCYTSRGWVTIGRPTRARREQEMGNIDALNPCRWCGGGRRIQPTDPQHRRALMGHGYKLDHLAALSALGRTICCGCEAVHPKLPRTIAEVLREFPSTQHQRRTTRGMPFPINTGESLIVSACETITHLLTAKVSSTILWGALYRVVIAVRLNKPLATITAAQVTRYRHECTQRTLDSERYA